MPAWTKDEYVEVGFRAHRDEQAEKYDNPYPADGWRGKAWLEGWEKAQATAKKEREGAKVTRDAKAGNRPYTKPVLPTGTDSPYQAGYNAAKAGADVNDNPYDHAGPGDMDYDHWLQGYIDYADEHNEEIPPVKTVVSADKATVFALVVQEYLINNRVALSDINADTAAQAFQLLESRKADLANTLLYAVKLLSTLSNQIVNSLEATQVNALKADDIRELLDRARRDLLA